MARCDLRDKPIRERWEKENKKGCETQQRKISRDKSKDSERKRFNEKMRQNEGRTWKHLEMGFCKNYTESSLASYCFFFMLNTMFFFEITATTNFES